MPYYRRNYVGQFFFFTVVTFQRRLLFDAEHARRLLREAITQTRRERPWTTEGVVLLPNHLHTIWRMPEGNTDYSTRIAVIKKRFTRAFLGAGGADEAVPSDQRRHRRRGVWQPRFWEHTIRNAKDFRMHLDYIHLNPVKHGLVRRPIDWPWSTFRQYVQLGWYEADWCGRTDLPESVEYFWPEPS